MITFLEGALEDKQPTLLVLNCGGVGYEVHIPLSSFDRLPATGERCRLLIHHHVREEEETLFGFSTEAERRLFRLLLDVAGVGPKTAIGALSGISPRELKAAIVQGDVQRLSSVSGIGKKTAERIVVELRDKLSAGDALEAVAGGAAPTAADVRRRDAVLALVSLGYKQAEALKRVHAVLPAGAGDDLSVEDVVRLALAGR